MAARPRWRWRPPPASPRAIALARIGGGWLVDRFAVPHVMCAAHALALCGGLLLTLLPAPVTAVLGLGMVGLGYGFVSGATAGGIGLYWRPADYGRVAGRTYIAWCLAAVSLPVLAGYLFDMTRAYSTAVLIAAGANVAGMAMALTMPRRGWREGRVRLVPTFSSAHGTGEQHEACGKNRSGHRRLARDRPRHGARLRRRRRGHCLLPSGR